MTRAEVEAEFNGPPTRERLERWRAGLLSGDRAPPSGVSVENALLAVDLMLERLRQGAAPGLAS